MSKKAHETALPMRRFPEFRDAEAWVEKKLGELTYPISERNKKDKKLPVYSISNVNGFVPQSSQFEGIDSHERGYDVTLYKIVGKNTFAYNPARINVGSIGYSEELNEVLISSLYVCFKTNDDLNDLFLWHFIKSAAFNQAVNNTVEGGIRSYLFYENLATIKIQIPSLLEQQKIATTLSSLDALLTAQTAKLTALQDHKRGLMQDLFPSEGETVPKLRFPKFQDAGEWVGRKLSDVLTEHGSKSTGREEVYSVSVHKGLINQIEHLGRSYSAANTDHYKKVIPGDVVYTKSPTGNFPFGIIKQSKIINTVIVSPLYGVFTPVNYALGSFIDLYFSSPMNTTRYLEPIVQKGAKNTINISNGVFLSKSFLFPPDDSEAKKIADCLSSLDNLITAQSQKIDALKLHKKGLMQALFPAASEPAA